MTRINRAYVKRLEDLIVQLDSTFSDIEAAQVTSSSNLPMKSEGSKAPSLERDMPLLHKEAEAIRCRRARGIVKRGQTNKSNGCPDE